MVGVRVGVMDIAAIRRFAGLSQNALADRMGTKQTVVSKLEHQTDWKLSTLVEYLLGTGLEVRLSVLQSDGFGRLELCLSPDTRQFETVRSSKVVRDG